MSARIAYYQHIIDLYNSSAHTKAWDQRLESHRRWLHSPKTLSWPKLNKTFEQHLENPWMNSLELVRFLSDSAKETIDRAEATKGRLAKILLDEAEELLALGSKIACRAKTNVNATKKAA